MIEIQYDNTIEEVICGVTRFNRKYLMRRTVMFTIAFSISFLLSLNIFINNPSSIIGPVVMALSAGMIFIHWWRPYQTKKRLTVALQGLDEEKYRAQFFDDKIIIETEIISGDGDGESDGESNGEAGEIKRVEPTVITIGREMLYSDIDDTAIRLFVNRSFIYIFPKRCLSKEQAEQIENYFYDKSI